MGELAGPVQWRNTPDIWGGHRSKVGMGMLSLSVIPHREVGHQWRHTCQEPPCIMEGG